MNDKNEMSIQDKRNWKRAEFKRRFGKYWLIYLALIGTGILSAFSGAFLPFQPNEEGYVVLTLGGIVAALYYAGGFLSTGELAANFWFGLLTDHDKDNAWQVAIAVTMLSISIVTVLVTSLAAGAFIAYWLGALEQFEVMPLWAQTWVVWAIPALWVAHAVMGMAFKALSEEAEADRDANAVVRAAQQKIVKAKADARAKYWEQNAPDIALRLGQMEAQDEIDQFSAKLKGRGQQNNGQHNQPRQQNVQPALAKAAETKAEALADPTTRP